MTKLKKQLALLPEEDRLSIARELLMSLSESTIRRFGGEIFAHLFKTQNPHDQEQEAISGEEMKAWIREQIALSESAYADKMMSGDEKSYTLKELKSHFNG